MKLKRTRQCQLCPWKVSTNPFDIPHGYSVEQHRALAATIADPENIIGQVISDGTIVMGCHEHESSERVFCVGWLHNQLTTGNNIQMRLAMSQCENIQDLRIDGEQHETFEQTIPTTLPTDSE